MHETDIKNERAVLAAVDLGEYDIEASLAELEELALTAGIETAAVISQARKSLDSATCFGKGKTEELAEFVKENDIDIVIFDHELTGAQLRNIEKACEVPVMDRTMLILEIFAGRAHSSEGKIQVELAQHKYMLPRLAGLGITLSRLGGGGAGGGGARRGKGETQLELDRRHIRRRIASLEKEIEEVKIRRDNLRSRRKKDGTVCVAVVGYTNVGKSTLLNYLTDAGVLAENKLFATLDPTSRALILPDGREVLLIDTVGFISRLPHHLVEAFKSTLEEAVNADLILNVCDISAENFSDQISITKDILESIGAGSVPVLTVLNKADKLDKMPDCIGKNTVVISAKTGFGTPEMLGKIADMLDTGHKRMSLLIPYDNAGVVAEIRKEGSVFTEEYTDSGIRVDALVAKEITHKVKEYIL